jgi:Family of unknown function (DUF6281)
MRTFAIILTAFALAAAGCGGADSPQTAAPSPQTVTDPVGCGIAGSTGFNWNGRLYARDAGELDKPFVLGKELGQGVEPNCADMGGGTKPLGQAITVVRIKGVDPDVAVGRPDDDRLTST